jgi:hypothetical protein
MSAKYNHLEAEGEVVRVRVGEGEKNLLYYSPLI